MQISMPGTSSILWFAAHYYSAPNRIWHIIINIFQVFFVLMRVSVISSLGCKIARVADSRKTDSSAYRDVAAMYPMSLIEEHLTIVPFRETDAAPGQ